MTQNEKVQKYLEFSNKILAMAKEVKLRNVIALCKADHVDTHYFAYLVKKGYFYMFKGGSIGYRGKYYQTDRTDLFLFSEVKSFLDDMVSEKKLNKENTPKYEFREPLSDFRERYARLLSEYTPRELIDELKRRGYSGSLTFTKEIKF